MRYWLAKQEPTGPRGYGFDRLKRDGRTSWDGVRNNLALKHMREMKPGDLVLYYHTGGERRAVGIMQVASLPYPDPGAGDERFVAVDVKYKRALKRPVTLDEIKADPRLRDWELVRMSRLSVMPVPKKVWDIVMKMGG